MIKDKSHRSGKLFNKYLEANKDLDLEKHYIEELIEEIKRIKPMPYSNLTPDVSDDSLVEKVEEDLISIPEPLASPGMSSHKYGIPKYNDGQIFWGGGNTVVSGNEVSYKTHIDPISPWEVKKEKDPLTGEPYDTDRPGLKSSKAYTISKKPSSSSMDSLKTIKSYNFHGIKVFDFYEGYTNLSKADKRLVLENLLDTVVNLNSQLNKET